MDLLAVTPQSSHPPSTWQSHHHLNSLRTGLPIPDSSQKGNLAIHGVGFFFFFKHCSQTETLLPAGFVLQPQGIRDVRRTRNEHSTLLSVNLNSLRAFHSALCFLMEIIQWRWFAVTQSGTSVLGQVSARSRPTSPTKWP